ncbi:hypothetical protein ACIQVE_21260 [Pseudomonas sp. NPDC098747]|uniref:hypothetical protein n=1 Tax=Pseudomonas sp. NPDC098747 TaxID=3364487 RepID=UPI00383BBBF4
MKDLNERPRSIDWHGPYRETARIEFVWGAEDNPIPLGFNIKVTAPGAQERTLRETAVYLSFDAAKIRSIEVAEDAMRRMSGTI